MNVTGAPGSKLLYHFANIIVEPYEDGFIVRKNKTVLERWNEAIRR